MTTYLRISQIRKPDDLDDTLSQAAIAGIEGTAVDLDDFLNGVLSQIKRAVGGADWHSAIESGASDPRSLKTVTDDVYYKSIMRARQVLTDITVPAAQNYVVLSAAASETPSETAAAGAGASTGAIVAVLAGDVGSHSVSEVAGINAITPKNLVFIRDAVTQDPLFSDTGSGGVPRQVYGLLQAELATADGEAFNDTTKQVQISFVRQNAAGTGLEAVPVADIENKVVNYEYSSRTKMHLLNEQDFLALKGSFADAQSFAQATLQQAYQAGSRIDVLTAEGQLTFDLSQDLTEFRIQRGGAAFVSAVRDDTNGDSLNLDLDALDVNSTTAPDFNQGIKVATSGTTINVGVTAGQVDASALTLRATTGDAILRSDSGEVQFRDSRETTPIPLTDATAGAISALPGGPYTSLSAAIRSALLSADLDIFLQVIQTAYLQDQNVPGSGNGNAQDWSPALDLSARSIDFNTPATVDTLIFFNGMLLVGGNNTTNNDVYAGTTPANGDLRYDFITGVKAGDTVVALSWKAA